MKDLKSELLSNILIGKMLEAGSSNWEDSDNPTEIIDIKVPVNIKKLINKLQTSGIINQTNHTTGGIITKIMSNIVSEGLNSMYERGVHRTGVHVPITKDLGIDHEDVIKELKEFSDQCERLFELKILHIDNESTAKELLTNPKYSDLYKKIKDNLPDNLPKDCTTDEFISEIFNDNECDIELVKNMLNLKINIKELLSTIYDFKNGEITMENALKFFEKTKIKFDKPDDKPDNASLKFINQLKNSNISRDDVKKIRDGAISGKLTKQDIHKFLESKGVDMSSFSDVKKEIANDMLMVNGTPLATVKQLMISGVDPNHLLSMLKDHREGKIEIDDVIEYLKSKGIEPMSDYKMKIRKDDDILIVNDTPLATSKQLYDAGINPSELLPMLQDCDQGKIEIDNIVEYLKSKGIEPMPDTKNDMLMVNDTPLATITQLMVAGIDQSELLPMLQDCDQGKIEIDNIVEYLKSKGIEPMPDDMKNNIKGLRSQEIKIKGLPLFTAGQLMDSGVDPNHLLSMLKDHREGKMTMDSIVEYLKSKGVKIVKKNDDLCEGVKIKSIKADLKDCEKCPKYKECCGDLDSGNHTIH